MNVFDPGEYKYGSPPDTPRPMTNYLAQQGKTELVGVEVGVLEGANALSMLTVLDISRMYLIDPFLAYNDRSDDDMEECRILAEEHMREYQEDGIVVWIQDTSVAAAAIIDDESVDFVYLLKRH